MDDLSRRAVIDLAIDGFLLKTDTQDRNLKKPDGARRLGSCLIFQPFFRKADHTASTAP